MEIDLDSSEQCFDGVQLKGLNKDIMIILSS